MNLREAFDQIGRDLNLNAEALSTYADEDRVGGYHADPEKRRWLTGSMWEDEGRFLYALVRAMKPRRVLEIGTWTGCSSSHMLEALAMNGRGKLTSIDENAGSGSGILGSLRKRWQFIAARAQDALPGGDWKDVDIVFEDGLHDPAGTVEILRAIREHIQPRLIISHDGAHWLVGGVVRDAYRTVWGEAPTVLLFEPCDCGFAYRAGGGA